MAGYFDLPCVARARLGPSYPTAKCEIGLMSSSVFIFYIFHQFNYISATKLRRLIAYSSLTRKHFFFFKKKVQMKRPCRGKGGSRTSRCGGSHPARPGLVPAPSPAWKCASTQPALSWAGRLAGFQAQEPLLPPRVASGAVGLWLCGSVLHSFSPGARNPPGRSLCCIKAAFFSAS